jgi:hypothetical protein
MKNKILRSLGLEEFTYERIKSGSTLYCFSPLVMVLTFIIEILFAIYTFIKCIKNKSDIGIVLALLFLAIFQLSEYQICDGSNKLLWSRIGLFAITFLPILGFHLISKLNKKSSLFILGLLIAIGFAAYFIFVPHTIEGATCGGNYIIFNINSGVYGLYGYYYFGFLLLGIWNAIKGIKSDSKGKIKKVLKWFIIGYLSFILPLTIVYIFIPITRVAVASIMCGFAVIFAFILTFKIAPIYHECVKLRSNLN